jgi:type VI secretion system protein ImpM
VPSVDRVGRYFPLTIVSQWPSQSPIETACNARAWFDAAEALALTAPDTTDLETFDAGVSRLSVVVDSPAAQESAQLHELIGDSEFPQRTSQWHVPLASVHSLQRAVNALAQRELERSLRPLSLWWSDGSDDVEAAWLCARGLPAPESFAAMLSGEWRAMGWSSVGTGTVRRANVQPVAPQRVDVTAAHEPVNRSWDAEPSAYFSLRPDVGLWGVSFVAGADAAAAQAMADVLQSVRPAASLTILVEEVRSAIEAVQRQFSRSALASADSTGLANVIVFVASGAECALVCSGTVQALRCRSSEVTPVVGIGPYEAAAVPAPVRDAAAVNGTLLDLITGSAVSCVAPEEKSNVRVCYESLRADDRWLIAGDALFDETQLPWLAAAMKQESTNPMAAVRSACGANVEQSPLPVMLLSTRAASVHVAGPVVGQV